MTRFAAVSLAVLAAAMTLGAAKPAAYDYVIRGGEILAGSGGAPGDRAPADGRLRAARRLSAAHGLSSGPGLWRLRL